MSTTIQTGGSTETPEQVTAREAAEAAALAAGGTVQINARDKTRGVDINIPPTGEVAKRPDDVPEKFWDAEKGVVNTAALLKAQADGQAYIEQLRQGKTEESPEAKAAREAAEAAAATETPEAKAAREAAEQDPTLKTADESAVQKAQAEFAEKGALSESTYAALAAQGLTKAMVDTHITSVKAESAAIEAATYEGAGGKAQFDAMAEWAGENMPESEAATINTLLASHNPDVAKSGAAQLKAYFDKHADIDPSVTLGGKPNNAGGAMFHSKHEMTQAMSDPRYSKDEAFRQQVAQKVARASAANIDLFS